MNRIGLSFLSVIALLSFAACGKDQGTATAPEKAEQAPKVVASGGESEPSAALELQEMDITEAAAKDLPGFSGSLKMNLPEGVAFSGGVGKLDVKKDGFELAIGSGYRVTEKKERLAKGGAVKDVEYLVDADDKILYSASMLGERGYFVVVDVPAIGGLVSTCETGISGVKTEELARKVLEACESVQYERN